MLPCSSASRRAEGKGESHGKHNLGKRRTILLFPYLPGLLCFYFLRLGFSCLLSYALLSRAAGTFCCSRRSTGSISVLFLSSL